MNEFQGVRIARPDEAEAIYNLLLDLHKENGLFKLNPAKAMQTIKDMLDPSRGVIGVIDGPTGLEGSIGLYLFSWYYTEDMHLAEFWNFVRADCRKSSHANKLIEFAKWCSERLGVPLHVGIVSTSRVKAKERLYSRRLKHVGGQFMWGATPLLNSDMDETINSEVDRAELLDEYRGVAAKLIAIDPNSTTSRKRREITSVIDRLKEIQKRADAVLLGK